MNLRIAKTFLGFAVVVGAIIGMLTWWQVIEAGSLRDRDYNQQVAWYQQRIERGPIVADGETVANSVDVTSVNGDTVYERRYPLGNLTAHVVGYATSGKARTGVERAWNDALIRANDQLAALIDTIRGTDDRPGDTVELSLDLEAQRVARDALADRPGSIIVMDPQTGEVVTMVSAPGYNPEVTGTDDFQRLAKRQDAPLLNRATQAGYVPGSTFKLMTAAAALEEGIADPDTMFQGGCEFPTSGPPVKNFGGSCNGPHTLATALQRSINTTFADLGTQVGATTLRDYMRKFGFESPMEVEDLPGRELRESGLYDSSGALLGDDVPVDAARLGIGQERLQVTPLQMAQVVATIANGGVMMRPYLVREVRDPDGRVVHAADPSAQASPISATTADTLHEMMADVVAAGTGVAAQIQGVPVAGKTGTADTPQGNQVWFLGIAGDEGNELVIVVTLEAQSSGITGGGTAAPIARQVLETALAGRAPASP